MDHLNPVWDTFTINLEDICDDDKNKSIQIMLWDWEKRNKHRILGYVETTLEDLMERVVEKADGNANKSKRLSNRVTIVLFSIL